MCRVVPRRCVTFQRARPHLADRLTKPPPRHRARVWRPALLWAAVLVRVEPDHLLLNDTSGRGDFVLPGAPITGR